MLRNNRVTYITILILIVTIYMIVVFNRKQINENMRVSITEMQKNKSVLIIGRGPSAYRKSSFDETMVDKVIKLKLCNVKTKNDCDIVVYYTDEIARFYDDYFEDIKIKHPKEIWIYDKHYGKYIRNDYNFIKQLSPNTKIRIMDHSYLFSINKKYGFGWDSKIPQKVKGALMTTGLATIFEAIRIFKLPIYIKGFDNITHKRKLGHYHNLDTKPLKCHNILKEYNILKQLIAEKKVVVVDDITNK